MGEWVNARHLTIGASLGLAAACLALLAAQSTFGVSLENSSYDWRMRVTARPETARQDIVLTDAALQSP